MAGMEIDLYPVEHITADAIGEPGKRVFYIQGWKGDQTVTLIIEKTQLQALAVGIEEFLREIKKVFPNLPQEEVDYQEEKMHITPPLDPLFRVGELHLGYHHEDDLAVIIAKEIPFESKNTSELATVRFWCTRSQLKALAAWGTEVSSRGRITCLLCGELYNPQENHLCIKKNGRKITEK